MEEFLKPMKMSQQQLADAIAVPRQWIDEIVTERRNISPSIALRLAKFFGMTPDFWINLQVCWDLYHVQQAEAADLARIATRSPHCSPQNRGNF